MKIHNILPAAVVALTLCFGAGKLHGATNSISAGETASGVIAVGETNFYSFAASSNDTVSILLTRSSGSAVYPTLELHAPDGTLVTSAFNTGGYDNLAYINARKLTQTGTYLILVRDDGGNDPFAYNLTLIKNPGPNSADDGGVIMPGQTVTNGIASAGDIDVYTFTATANDAVSILLTRSGGSAAYPTLELHAPDGTLVTSAFNTGGYDNLAYINARKLTQTGTYLIFVRDDGGNDPFPYSLTLIKNPGPNSADDGGVILPGQTVTNSIASAGDIDVYTFTATANDAVSILLTRSGGSAAYPTLELHAPDGTLVTSAFNTGGYDNLAYINARKLTQTGTYLILVRDDGGDDPFPYNLTLIKNPGPNSADDGGVILPGQTVTNSIASAGDIDIYTFTAAANEVVSILLTRNSGSAVYPTLELHAPDGTLVTSAFNTGGYDNLAYINARKLTQTGTYLILVRDDGGNDPFPYSLTLIKNPGPNSADDGGVILPGQTVTNSIASAGDIDVYTFTATANDAVSILLTRSGGSAAYPTLELHAPDGTLVTSAFNTGGYDNLAYINARKLTQTGTYLIFVRDDGGDDTFAYNLTLIKNPGPNSADDGGVILPGQTVTNSIASAGDIDVYTFTAAANDAVSILLTRSGGSAAYPTLELHAPDGTLVTSALNTGGYDNLAYINARKLTQTGTYLILVRDDGGNDTFPYNLTLIKNPGPNAPDLGDGGPTIQPGQGLTNTIGSPGDIDALSFYAIAGDTVTVSMGKIAGSGNYPYLQIQAPDGTVLANASGLSSATIHLDCLEQTGNYLAICRDDGGNETFTYRLSLFQSPIELPSSGRDQYLAIYSCSDEQVYLRWNTNATGYALQSTTNLTLPVWLAVTNIPYTIADHLYVNMGFPTNQSAFYRLICTNGTCGQ